MVQERNTEPREPNLFLRAIAYRHFVLEGDIIFIKLDSKPMYFLPQGEMLSLSSKAVHNTNILGRTVWKKEGPVTLLQNKQKGENLWIAIP